MRENRSDGYAFYGGGDITLNNSVKIPVLGLGPGALDMGVWRSPKSRLGRFTSRIVRGVWKRIFKNTQYVQKVANAIKAGYRLIDNSAAYGTEFLIGRAIKDSGVAREELFITSRVTNKAQYEGNISASFHHSLKALGLDYIDLYMIHWPVTGHYIRTLQEILKIYEQGLIKVVGVANCHEHHLDEIIDKTGFVPAINQIEVHPLFTQKKLITYCQKQGIVVEAYTPIARNDERLLRNRIIEEISKKYGKSIQQVVLRWHIQNGLIPVVRSLNKRRQRENLSLFDFYLTDEEMLRIDSININSRLRYDPDNCDFTRL